MCIHSSKQTSQLFQFWAHPMFYFAKNEEVHSIKFSVSQWLFRLIHQICSLFFFLYNHHISLYRNHRLASENTQAFDYTDIASPARIFLFYFFFVKSINRQARSQEIDRKSGRVRVAWKRQDVNARCMNIFGRDKAFFPARRCKG